MDRKSQSVVVPGVQMHARVVVAPCTESNLRIYWPARSRTSMSAMTPAQQFRAHHLGAPLEAALFFEGDGKPAPQLRSIFYPGFNGGPSALMKTPPTPKAWAPTQPGPDIKPLFAYIYTICITPFVVTRFAVDIALCLFPSARPSREWSFSQAVRIRALKLFLLYCSLVRAGTKLTLRSGREGSRFEVIRPSFSESYAGPLFDHEVSPEPLDVTWTPERPPLDALASTERSVTYTCTAVPSSLAMDAMAIRGTSRGR
jgi:hypothetical protein